MMPLPTKLRVRRVIGMAGIGLTIGAAAVSLRPFLDRSIHWEAVCSIFIALPTAFLTSVWANRNLPRGKAIIAIELEIFAAIAAFTTCWSLGFPPLADDIAGIMLLHWLVSGTVAAGLLLLWQKRRPVRFGPHCPGCGYCLIGLAEDRCSECGRSFTLAELNVDRAALHPSASEATTSP